MRVQPTGTNHVNTNFTNVHVLAKEFASTPQEGDTIASASTEKKIEWKERIKNWALSPFVLLSFVVRTIICVISCGKLCNKPSYNLQKLADSLKVVEDSWKSGESEDEKKAAFAALEKQYSGVKNYIVDRYVDECRKAALSDPKAAITPADKKEWEAEYKEKFATEAKEKLEDDVGAFIGDRRSGILNEIADKAAK